MIDLYCGINERQWNYHPVQPGPLACISPVYGSSSKTIRENPVSVPGDTEVFEDSGAFCDGPGHRLSFEGALQRQQSHAVKWGYVKQVKARASYDLLIDEKWIDGKRYKGRWTEQAAESAVLETIEAARYMDRNRIDAGSFLILSAQGVSPRQYLDCTREIIPLIQEGDILGLGGWCVVGKFPRQMFPVFQETMEMVLPYAASQGVKRVHLWGVIYAPALAAAANLCNRYGIHLSTDSAGPSLRPCFGAWGYADWTDLSYQRPPVEIRGLERARHVQAVRDWLSSFEPDRYLRPFQVRLF